MGSAFEEGVAGSGALHEPIPVGVEALERRAHVALTGLDGIAGIAGLEERDDCFVEVAG